MYKRLIGVLLIGFSSHAFAQNCIDEQTDQYGSSYLVNTCNKKLGPVNYCWESMEASCSCFKGAGCSVGAIDPGRRALITSPGRKQYARIKYSYCVYDSWVAGRCRPDRFR
jgi:hypothetical protein